MGEGAAGALHSSITSTLSSLQTPDSLIELFRGFSQLLHKAAASLSDEAVPTTAERQSTLGVFLRCCIVQFNSLSFEVGSGTAMRVPCSHCSFQDMQ